MLSSVAVEVTPSSILSSAVVAVTPSSMFSSVAVDVTPSSMFNSAVVAVTPSMILSSAVVAVTPSKMFSSAAVAVTPSSILSSSGVDVIAVLLDAANTGTVPLWFGRLIVLSAVGSTIVRVVSCASAVAPSKRTAFCAFIVTVSTTVVVPPTDKLPVILKLRIPV